ncbi:MAG: imidazoleglycerol-phosphate dehydratase HisB [Oscillospiraceae bacterium]|nr:imidazoleglycerol-phosphate dehydratase HisB [Oscillospiraceae bacterium]MCD7792431.1 imidazoleglycerol-phosphate dehydratase HisB [Oscillospiraceae bacterium]MCD8254799.1 imidazoleglycerol-phosphate dehydratase HisB [Oscillospiraceae bacterium]MCD8375098.1 imidazoleglycerol-phosphate dehydratase HisB [Oscillospiraceae bacterium]
MRKAEITRNTAETQITLSLCLEGSGQGEISTGIGFLDHMLTLFARHGGFDLSVRCAGDTWVDGHHTTEDIGIALGLAFAEALGDKAGIRRYGDITLPMDEALVLAAVDISGRGFLRYTADIPAPRVGDFDTELTQEFFRALAHNAGLTLHIVQLDGENSHHIIEAMFKAAARALRSAAEIIDASGAVPSTKGVL